MELCPPLTTLHCQESAKALTIAFARRVCCRLCSTVAPFPGG